MQLVQGIPCFAVGHAQVDAHDLELRSKLVQTRANSFFFFNTTEPGIFWEPTEGHVEPVVRGPQLAVLQFGWPRP